MKEHALVIGGTHGLGREVVRKFSARGAAVSVIGRGAPPEEDKEIAGAAYYRVDLADRPGLEAALDEVLKASGPLNYVVFCQRYRGKDDAWQGEFDVTLSATRAVIERLAGHFSPEGEKAIAMVGSVFGEHVGKGQPLSYHVGKAGLNQIVRYYAVNLGRSGIRVNCVTPFTFLKAESRKFYLENKPLQDMYKKIVPLGRMATTEDISDAIDFLCSKHSRYITGQNINIDGGLSLVWPETLARELVEV